MLFFPRAPGQSLTLQPRPGLDPCLPAATLFESGPIRVQVVGLRESAVYLGVAAPVGLCVLRDDFPLDGMGAPVGSLRQALAQKLRVLRFMRRHNPESLADAAGVPVARVLAAEGAGAILELDDLEKLARALGVVVAELFRPVGWTAEERLLLAILEGEE